MLMKCRVVGRLRGNGGVREKKETRRWRPTRATTNADGHGAHRGAPGRTEAANDRLKEVLRQRVKTMKRRRGKP